MADDIINDKIFDLENELFGNSTESRKNRFEVSLNFGLESCESSLYMSICINRLSNISDTNIEVVSVVLPSGFQFFNGTKENNEVLV